MTQLDLQRKLTCLVKVITFSTTSVFLPGSRLNNNCSGLGSMFQKEIDTNSLL